MKNIGDRLKRYSLKGNVVIQLLTIGGFLCLFGASQNASATNYFSWGAEGNTVIMNGSSAPIYSYKGNTTRDCTVAHSGSCSMRLKVIGNDSNNQGMGAEIDQNTYSWNIINSSSIYYRWWMKIMPGFSWGTASGGHHLTKASRVLGKQYPRVYTGFLRDYGFSISECDVVGSVQPGGGCSPNVGGDDAAVVGKDMTAMNDGQWHEYIVRVKPNTTTTSSNAELQVWVDGVSIGQVNNWKLHSYSSNQMVEAWGGWMVYPYFQLGSTASDGGTIYLDDFSTDDSWNSLIPGGGTTTLAPPTDLQIQ